MFAFGAPDALKITPVAKTIKIHSAAHGRGEAIVVHLETIRSLENVLFRTTTQREIL